MPLTVSMPPGLTATCYIVQHICRRALTCWSCTSNLSPSNIPRRERASKSFEKTLHHKPLTRIILMIQIRGNGLLTVIKVDVITRDVKAVTKLRETLISPPSICSKVEQGGYLNYATLRHNVLPISGKINKRQ